MYNFIVYTLHYIISSQNGLFLITHARFHFTSKLSNHFYIIRLCARFAHKRYEKLEAPLKTETPYGGRLTFQLPAGNLLIIHLKDNSKIRNKKRWSQVMYMYYLLGFKFFGSLESMEKLYDDMPKIKEVKTSKAFTGFGSLLNNIEPKLRNQVRSFFCCLIFGFARHMNPIKPKV